MDASHFPDKWWSSLPDDDIAFEVATSVDPTGNPKERVFCHVTRAALERKNDVRALVEQDYTLGTAINIPEVVFKVAGDALAPSQIRRFDPSNLLARGGYEKGSCPILSVRSPAALEYRTIGPVLIDGVGREAQRQETIDLREPVDTIRLSELENETTFIEHLNLVIRDTRGNHVSVLPDGASSLWTPEHRYVVLRPGTNRIFHFTVPPKLEGSSLRQLTITGYYVPQKIVFPQ